MADHRNAAYGPKTQCGTRSYPGSYVDVARARRICRIIFSPLEQPVLQRLKFVYRTGSIV